MKFAYNFLKNHGLWKEHRKLFSSGHRKLPDANKCWIYFSPPFLLLVLRWFGLMLFGGGGGDGDGADVGITTAWPMFTYGVVYSIAKPLQLATFHCEWKLAPFHSAFSSIFQHFCFIVVYMFSKKKKRNYKRFTNR